MSILSNPAKNREKSGDFFSLVEKNRRFYSTCGTKTAIFFHLWKKTNKTKSTHVFVVKWIEKKSSRLSKRTELTFLSSHKTFHNVVTIEQRSMFNTIGNSKLDP